MSNNRSWNPSPLCTFCQHPAHKSYFLASYFTFGTRTKGSIVEILSLLPCANSHIDAVGQSPIIKEDRLGLDIIYVQAKRWENTVGRPEIQKFAGALQGQRARKGIFITTSDFSREARDYASHINTKIILIDGDQLTQFMIDYNIGVTPVSAYEVKKLDSDYFTEE